MPAGATIIGRVAVKVLPDTQNFRREAQRELDRHEKRLKLTVPTKIDMTGVSREFLEELRKINQRNRNNDNRKIRFHATISRDGMRDAVVSARRHLEALARQERIKFHVDNLNVGHAKLTLDEDALKDVEDQLERWRNRVSPIKVEVEPNLDGVAVASARLAVLTRPRMVRIVPVLDSAAVTKVATALAALSGARVLSNYFDDITDSLSRLDKNVPKIAGVATALAGLSAWGMAATSNIASLVVSIASIAPAALALPGILGGLAIGIGTTVAAMKDFNTVFPHVKQALTDMQTLISKNFWAEAEAPMRRMLDSLLPELTKNLGQTAQALGGYFGALSDGIRETLVDKLASMFEDLNHSIMIAASGTNALVGIITTLGQVGAGYLPRLAQWFVDITTRFDNFLSKAHADGRLTDWIDAGVQAFLDLGTVIGKTAEIIYNIGKAAEAAGGSTLSTLADKLRSIADITGSGKFQSNLTLAFKAAHEAMNQISTISGPAVRRFFENLGQLAQQIFPIVGRTIGTALDAIASAINQPVFQSGLVNLFGSIERGIASLAPAMAPVGRALGALMPVVGALAENLGPLLATMFTTLAGVAERLAPPIIVLIDLLGAGLHEVLKAISPIITDVAGFLGGLLYEGLAQVSQVAEVLAPTVGVLLANSFNTLKEILPVLADAAKQVAQIFGEAAKQILPKLVPLLDAAQNAFGRIFKAVAPLIPQIVGLVVSVLTPLIKAVMELATKLLPKLAKTFEDVAPTVSRLLEVLQKVWDFVSPVLIPALKLLAEVLFDTVMFAIRGVTRFIDGALSFITGIWNVFAGFFTGDWRRMWTGIKEIFSGIWDMIVGAFMVFMSVGILGAARKIFMSLKAFFKSTWDDILLGAKAIWGAIRRAWDETLNAIKSSGSNMLSSIKNSWSTAWETIKGILKFAWDGIKTAVSQGFQTMLTTTRTKVSEAVTLIRELPSKAKAALSNIGSTLSAAGRQLIEGFIKGIKDKFASVQQTLGKLTDLLPSWKGPVSKDKVLLTSAGQVLIDGLIKGLESRYGAVRASLKGLTNDIGGMEMAVPGVNIPLPRGGVARGLSAHLDGDGSQPSQTKILNYYAAAGSSLDSEEDLFAASARTRMGW